MTDIQHGIRKRDKQFLFQVKLDWLSGKEGILSAADVHGTVRVATPPVFGGVGSEWSPEHLFLSAVSSCFMTTYLVFARNFDFEISGFECSTIGRIALVEDKYQFTTIDIFPKIYVADEALKQKARLALEKTQKSCLISNSIKAEMIYHSEVLTGIQNKPASQEIKTINGFYEKL